MKTLLAAAIAAVFLSGMASAQAIQVRSGQHDGFTRLIVDLPSRLEYEISNVPGKTTVSFPDQRLNFDVAPVFQRIAQNQITDVSAGGDGQSLEIDLGCKCAVTPFWHGTSLLVLDIRESDEVVYTEPETPEDAQPETPRVPRTLKVTESNNSLAASLANAHLAAPETRTPSGPPDHLPEEEAIAPDDEVISEAREKLVRQLSRAAAQGLLSPRRNLRAAADGSQETTGQHAGEPEQERVAPISPISNVNLRAESSIDRDFLSQIGAHNNLFESSACVEDSALDIRNWGTDAPFSEQVGALRVNLMGEFDALDQNVALDLARLYLHFGFGIEAQHTLEMLGSDAEEHRLLYDLADIMDHGQVMGPSELSGQLNCGGAAALWSAMSHTSLPTDAPFAEDAILQSFEALPRHLRNHLGATLSRRLMEAGHKKTADHILRSLNRQETPLPADARLVEAQLDEADGKDGEAAGALKEVVETNTEPSAEALIQLIRSHVKAGDSVSFELAELAGAYVQQNRGGELEQDLVQAYVVSLSASGAFDQSYDEYDRLMQVLKVEQQRQAKAEMLNQLTKGADDITFLRRVLTDHTEDRDEITPFIANDTARRLLDMGFAAQAKPFVANDVPSRPGQERRLLRAEILLAQGLPAQAEADLVNVEGEMATLLRANARSKAGDHGAAAEIYASVDSEDDFLREAWLAENWDALSESGDSALADMAALATLTDEPSTSAEDSAQVLGPDRILAQNRNLLQQSLATRDAISGVLQAKPSPE